MDGYLPKPLNLEAFCAELAKLGVGAVPVA